MLFNQLIETPQLTVSHSPAQPLNHSLTLEKKKTNKQINQLLTFNQSKCIKTNNILFQATREWC